MNKPRKFKKNMTGISCSLNKGRINLSLNVIKYLRKPKKVSLYSSENPDFLYVVAGEHEDAPIVLTINYKSSPAFISSKNAVREIYRCYSIRRNDNDVMSPFYSYCKTRVKNSQAVIIVMDNFANYR